MNSETGATTHFETFKDAFDAGYDIPLTEPEAEELMGLTRAERHRRKAEKIDELRRGKPFKKRK